VLLGTAIGWVAAATGYGVPAVGLGLVLAVLPGLAALVLVTVPELRGRDPVDWVRHLVRAWYEMRPPWQVGAGLLAGAVLWAFLGGDAGAVAMAAAVPFGRPSGERQAPGPAQAAAGSAPVRWG
jgi:hypothetical protein